jgi:HPr kinase/phosphorylase
LAERTTVHGVFLEVLGMGVLLVGDPGIGKSELALEMVVRGHRLVADDAPEMARVGPEILQGTCSPVLRDFLEVRGLGVLNLRAMFGEAAVQQSGQLHLIVNMRVLDDEAQVRLDRLRGCRSSRVILGVTVPEVTLPVAPGRNLAVLLETAVRNEALRMRGYDASEDLIERQAHRLNETARGLAAQRTP